MRITVEKDMLLYGVTAVQRAVSTKNILPILAGLHMEAKDGHLSFRATDLELDITTSIPVIAEEEGTAVLPAKHFIDLVKRLPDGQLAVTVENGSATISYGKSTFSVQTIASNEVFPEPFSIDQESTSLSIPALEFKRVVRQVANAASSDTARPVFTGVYFEGTGEELNIVATDTHRLAWNRLKVPALDTIKLIVPIRALNEVTRINLNEGEFITLNFDKNRIQFGLPDGTLISSRLINGAYPEFRRVIPANFVCSAKVSQEVFLNTMERCSVLLSDSKDKRVKLNLNGHLEISAQSENCTIYESLDIEREGEKQEICFNVAYLVDAAKSILDNNFTISFSGQLSPTIIKPETKTNTDRFLYLILPVRGN